MRQVSQILSVFLASSAILATSSTTLAGILTAQDPPPETIKLNLVTDDLLKGEATLSGLIRIEEASQPRSFIAIGNNWLFKVTVKINLINEAPFYILEAQAQHTSNPPPHTDEITPGPLLKTPSQNIDDLEFIDPMLKAGKEREVIREIHEGPDNHYDKLTSILIDLAPNSPGFGLPTGLDGDFGRTISARFITVHSPEPSSILSLLALGTLGTASTLKRKLKSSKSTEKGTIKSVN